MKYLLLIANDPDAWEDPGPTGDDGVLVDGKGLHGAETATTVRIQAGKRVLNDGPFVVILRADGFRELFMGDAGEASEARLLAAGIDLHADAVKVGHHGSGYASTTGFVAAVHPQIAVISVGRHNTFGHPAEATIEAWHDTGADVLRTDQCGAISLVERSPTTMLSCPSP